MICRICGKDISDAVYPLHMKRCKKVEEVKEDMTKYTVKELKKMCKERGITGYSRKKEAELIEMLQGGE